MVTAQTVPSDLLIKAIAEELKSNETIFQPPEWANFVKLGVSREYSPEQRKDWWYVRVASILRKVYLCGPIGVIHMKKMYGGRKNRGNKPEYSTNGSGSIIRHAFHQLEKAGYIALQAGEGRTISPEGRSFVDRMAFTIQQKIPELSKY